MKVYCSSPSNTLFWEKLGADVIADFFDPDLKLAHFGDRTNPVDGFITGDIGEGEGDILADMQELLMLRYAMKNSIPIVSTGLSTKLVAVATNHFVRRPATFTASKTLTVPQFKTSLSLQDEYQIESQLSALDFEIDESFCFQSNPRSAYSFDEIARSPGSTDVYIGFVPDFKFLLFQPVYDTTEYHSELFLQLVDSICLKK
jgi:hypothetical protein